MKNFSIKFLAMALAFSQGVMFTSCDSKEDDTPQLPEVTVTSTHYNLATDPINVEVKASVAPTADLRIPVSVSGDAKEGSDYVLAAKEIVIKAGETTGSLEVKRGSAEIGENTVTLTLNLQPGNGYTLNMVNYCEISLLGKNGYIMSFESNTGDVVDEDEFSILLSKMDGWDYKVPAEETFELEIVPEKSTAVEGTHYSFPAGKTVKVAVKKDKGSFKVKLLKVEEDKNILTLRLKEKAGFATGANPEIQIRLKGIENLSGTWAFSEFTEMDMYSMYGEDLEKAPKATSSDQITFAGSKDEGYMFTPDLKGDLKNYFGTEARKITFASVKSKLFEQTSMNSYFASVPTYKFADINVKFSTKYTQKRDAYVGMRIIQVDGKEVLEMTIDDWEPAEDEFAGMTYSFMKDMTEGNVSGSEWIPLRLHFSRVK